jgi:hypothetical protein
VSVGRCATGAAFAFATLAACAPTASLGEKPRCLIGLATGAGLDDLSILESVETRLGRRMSLDRIYRNWDDAVPDEREAETIANGRIPIVSFNGRRDGSLVSWASVASGAEDARLRAIASGFEALGRTSFVIYHQNPDKDSPEFGTPEEYRAAYRHVVDVFRLVGSGHVTFAWTMRSPSFPARADEFYPGDDVVDWIGANAYNYADPSNGGRWLSLRALLSDFVSWSRPHHKLLMVPEFASIEDPNDSTRKANWLSDAVGALRELADVRAVAYFDSDGDLSLDSSNKAFAAFTSTASDPLFAPE